MSSLEVSANSFLRALTIYVDTPSSDTKFQLQRRANDFVRAVIEHENTIEQRVTDHVLKALSLQSETGDAIKQIDGLKSALDRSGGVTPCQILYQIKELSPFTANTPRPTFSASKMSIGKRRHAILAHTRLCCTFILRPIGTDTHWRCLPPLSVRRLEWRHPPTATNF